MPQRENDGPEIRGSQTVVPFGVGGLYEWRGESFIACDTRMWKKGPNKQLATVRPELISHIRHLR